MRSLQCQREVTASLVYEICEGDNTALQKIGRIPSAIAIAALQHEVGSGVAV